MNQVAAVAAGAAVVAAVGAEREVAPRERIQQPAVARRVPALAAAAVAVAVVVVAALAPAGGLVPVERRVRPGLPGPPERLTRPLAAVGRLEQVRRALVVGEGAWALSPGRVQGAKVLADPPV
jgi:hypothetical protein